MRSRSIHYCISISKSRHQSSRLTCILSHRFQSTQSHSDDTTQDDTPNTLESDQSILEELQTQSFELSEDELTKISDANGATIIDGIEYLQPSGTSYHRLNPYRNFSKILTNSHQYISQTSFGPESCQSGPPNS